MAALLPIAGPIGLFDDWQSLGRERLALNASAATPPMELVQRPGRG